MSEENGDDGGMETEGGMTGVGAGAMMFLIVVVEFAVVVTVPDAVDADADDADPATIIGVGREVVAAPTTEEVCFPGIADDVAGQTFFFADAVVDIGVDDEDVGGAPPAIVTDAITPALLRLMLPTGGEAVVVDDGVAINVLPPFTSPFIEDPCCDCCCCCKRGAFLQARGGGSRGFSGRCE